MFDLFDMDFSIETEVVCIGKNKEGGAYNQSVLLSKLGYETVLLEKDEEIPEVKVVSISEVFDEGFRDISSLTAVLEKARQAAEVVCVDLSLKEENVVNLSEIKELLSMIDFLFLDKAEGKRLTGEAFPMAIAQSLYECGVKHVVIKDGRNGCFLYSEGLRFAMGALPCEVIDAQGVGDNFVAGFIYGLLDEVNLRDCCEYGSACAAISLGLNGAISEAEKRKVAIKELLTR